MTKTLSGIKARLSAVTQALKISDLEGKPFTRWRQSQTIQFASELLPLIKPTLIIANKMDLYTATQRHPHVVARVDARRDIEVGQGLNLYLDMEKVHVFEPGETGANLLLADQAVTALG